MKYTIEDLREGRCVIVNDGTIKELRAVLKAAFPEDDSTVIGCARYYSGKKVNKNSSPIWIVNKEPYPRRRRQSVRDFLPQIKMCKKYTKKELIDLCTSFFLAGENYGVMRTRNPDYNMFVDNPLEKLLDKIK